MAKTTELKKCPFCGADAELLITSNVKFSYMRKDIPSGGFNIQKLNREKLTDRPVKQYSYEVRTYVPRCSNPSCIARSVKKFSTKEDAIKAWNERAAI